MHRLPCQRLWDPWGRGYPMIKLLEGWQRVCYQVWISDAVAVLWVNKTKNKVSNGGTNLSQSLPQTWLRPGQTKKCDYSSTWRRRVSTVTIRESGNISTRREIVEFRWDTQNTQTIPYWVYWENISWKGRERQCGHGPHSSVVMDIINLIIKSLFTKLSLGITLVVCIGESGSNSYQEKIRIGKHLDQTIEEQHQISEKS